MRRRFVVPALILAVLSFLPLSSARGSIGVSNEIYYYNYGSSYDDGSEGIDCAGWHWADGDRTPTNGELRLIVHRNCSTWDVTYQWYRWNDPGCQTPYWQAIQEPVYYREVAC